MILDTIAASAKLRVERAKSRLSQEELKAKIYCPEGIRNFHGRKAFAFEQALDKRNRSGENVRLGNSPVSFICEIKKASPSKGVIAEDFPYLDIAREYVSAGADAISVLTEPEYFQGDDRYLSEISREVPLPVIRKDFTLDEYQIYEAKLLGADAVLLICSLLDTVRIKDYLALCNELGMSALVEAHSAEEIASALEAGARIIGVNNRNLKTFQVDIQNSIRLRSLVPENIIFVAESGIQSPGDIAALRAAGVDAVLIGETLMRSGNKKEELDHLRGRD
ncbi:indole-3-glycerol phosphate synthase [Anaerotaenia torta]|uniref:indole-3-glycerol phosphate synthase TrpC n=1 Tax=Anaerotaenia torta TaxID=433293 RepID=UPI003D1FC299